MYIVLKVGPSTGRGADRERQIASNLISVSYFVTLYFSIVNI